MWMAIPSQKSPKNNPKNTKKQQPTQNQKNNTTEM